LPTSKANKSYYIANHLTEPNGGCYPQPFPICPYHKTRTPQWKARSTSMYHRILQPTCPVIDIDMAGIGSKASIDQD
jgi:hypothetical protein